MAYVAPSITASANTFASLQSTGYIGHLEKIIGTNGALTANQINMLRSIRQERGRFGFRKLALDNVQRLLDQFGEGIPVANATVTQQILDLATVFSAMKVMMDEIGVLVDANQGSLHTRLNGAGNTETYRTFP